MLEILIKIIATLKADAVLTAIVPAGNIFTGPVDALSEFNSPGGIILPAVVLSVVSESQRPVPQNVRDTQVQLDVYSRVGQLELEQMYEQIISDLSMMTYNQGGAHVFWQLLSGAHDNFETERRIWHRAVTFQIWSVKPVTVS